MDHRTNEDKRIERLNKKLKPFFDEKLKHKQRLANFLTFLDATDDTDQTKYFQEHGQKIWEVSRETFWYHAEKIKNKEKPDKQSKTLLKDLGELLKPITVASKLFFFSPSTFASGWQGDQIMAVLEALAVSDNHCRLRIEGFKLLLLYLNALQIEAERPISLYRRYITFHVFVVPPAVVFGEVADQPSRQLGSGQHYSVSGATPPPIVQNSAPMNARDSLDLLEEIFSNMVGLSVLASPDGDGQDDDGQGLGTLRFMWKIFSRYYLSVLFPLEAVDKERQSGTAEAQSGVAFITCPPQILLALINFLIKYGLDSLQTTAKISGDALGGQPTPQQATNMAVIGGSATSKLTNGNLLHHLLFGCEENREMIHEWIRQCFLVPFFWSDIIRGGMFVLKSLLFCPSDERPQFLQHIVNPIEDSGLRPPASAQVYIQRYIKVDTPIGFWSSLKNQLERSTRWIQTINQWGKIMSKLTKIVSHMTYNVNLDGSTKEDSEGGRLKHRSHLGKGRARTINSGSPSSAIMIDGPVPGAGGGGGAADLVNIPVEDIKAKYGVQITTLRTPEMSADELRMKDSPPDSPNAHAKAGWHDSPSSSVGLIRDNIFKDIKTTSIHSIMSLNELMIEITVLYLEQNPSFHSEAVNWVVIIWETLLKPFNPKYYSYFYHLITKGLAGTDTKVIYAIISNCTNLFTLCLPGSHVLIPHFLSCIRRLLLPLSIGVIPVFRDHGVVPENVRQSAITIISSLLCYGSFFSEHELTGKSPSTTSRSEDASIASRRTSNLLSRLERNPSTLNDRSIYNALSSDLYCLLNDMVYSDPILGSNSHSTECYTMLLSAIAVLGYCESYRGSEAILPTKCIQTLLDHLSQNNTAIVDASVDGLLLFTDKKMTRSIHPSTLQAVVDGLTMAITEHIYLPPTMRSTKIENLTRLFKCLINWVMAYSVEIFSKPQLAQQIFRVLDTALNIDSQQKRSTSRDRYDAPANPPVQGILRGSSSGQVSDKFDPSTATSKNEDSDAIAAIKEIGSNALLHLLHHVGHFSPPYGPEIISSHDDSTLVSVNNYRSSPSTCPKTRLIFRNVTGKYTWDSQLFYEEEPRSRVEHHESTAEGSSVSSSEFLGVKNELLLGHDIKIEQTRREFLPDHVTYSRDTYTMPEWHPYGGAESADMLVELLKYIGNNHPDCLLEGQPSDLDTPANNLSAVSGDIAETSAMVKTQVEEEEDVQQLWEQVPVRPPKPDHKGPETCFQQPRLLLGHLGLLNFDGLKDGFLHMLTKCPPLYRDIKGLDKKYGREAIKLAIIYVGPGQEDEQSIFRNSRGSTEYEEFVSSLGWKINLSSHPGYMGGLERNQTTGKEATYYCDSTFEMVFHDITKMPNDPDDPKQLKKKRHIGNDHVHIVWNEHFRDYRKGTIGGDFGNAQIIIRPLVNGLFAINIERDAKVPKFGPLHDQMVVSKQILGPLTRWTAVQAYRSTMGSTQGGIVYQHPFNQRFGDIKIITSRHKAPKWTYESHLNSVFMNPKGCAETRYQ
ncbi:uncharacterized protein BJ171DRAFT_634486 [Polychytrium aggregatum]|uniref:uncharacterized protein n=1 Tax=Polychytrium aggregatum TaxID=110093 RepID=UPI0022FE8AE9|nr:uncharacterized protein BJ171DRAFT_634486 [Polychytrium aggregatum]KAI9197135.1 hypothetical protein BJ171DRAFT_634486 [Polychytrium aggregatum]